MYYTYVLLSTKYRTRYVGSAENVDKRLIQHNTGKVRYTKGRRPWELIYQEQYITRREAMIREAFFKTGQGRKILDNIFKSK